MAIPDYETIMLPLLEYAADRNEHAMRDVTEHLAKKFELTDDEIREPLPSGRQRRFENRVGWARTALKKAGLLAAPRESYIRITERGVQYLSGHPARITDKMLMEFPEYRIYKGVEPDPRAPSKLAEPEDGTSSISPGERLERAYSELYNALISDVLDKLKSTSPSFFEKIVVDVVHALGYGGTISDAARAIGRSGDGGVDGEIKEDPLGLDTLYIQAKRYTTNNVPAADVRDFVGALVGKRARRGVFITTAGNAADARRIVDNLEGKRVVLMDGPMLAQIMVERGIGVSTVETYNVRRIDEDYFSDVG